MTGSVRIERLVAIVLVSGLAAVGCAARYEGALQRDLASARAGLDDADAPAFDAGASSLPGPGPYVEYAMRAHPGLRAAYERWRATTLRISRARRLPEPTVSYGFFIQNVETRVGPQRHRLSVRQSFPWPTKLTAGADAVSMRARAMQDRFEARALVLRAAVEDHYWHLWRIRIVREVRREQAVILEELSAAVRGRLETGGGSLADLQQIDLARARLDDSIDALDELERQATSRLVDAIGAPADTRTPTTTSHPELALVGEDLEALRTAAAQHPAIEAFEHLADASEAQAASLEADRFPSFTLGVDWIETGDAPMPVQGSGTDPVIASIGIRIPLWQPSYDDSQRAAEADAEAHRAEGVEATNAAVARLDVTLSTIRDTERRASLHRDTLIPQALSAYESVLGSYATGRGAIAATLLAQRDLLELRENLVSAEAAHARAWAGLEAVVGRRVRRNRAGESDGE